MPQGSSSQEGPVPTTTPAPPGWKKLINVREREIKEFSGLIKTFCYELQEMLATLSFNSKVPVDPKTPEFEVLASLYQGGGLYPTTIHKLVNTVLWDKFVRTRSVRNNL